MEYGKIVSVTRVTGLFELVSSKMTGPSYGRWKTIHQICFQPDPQFFPPESIEIYTVRDNVNLVEVFTAMDSSSDKLPDGKDASVLKKYFEKVFPDLDFERVYSSDMKKIVKWFTILKAADVEIKLRSLKKNKRKKKLLLKK